MSSMLGASLQEPAAVVRRHRQVIAVVVSVLLVLGVLAYLNRDQARFDGPIDPRNPRPAGAQALAHVLADHGVEVSVVRGQAALLRQHVDSDTTVVVTDVEALGPSTLRRLRSHAERAGAVVLAGPAPVLGSLLDQPVGRLPSRSRAADCDEPLVRGLQVRTRGGQGIGSGEGCFGTAGTSALIRRGTTWMLASPATLSNAHVLEADDAALALRLLGQQPHLVWYVADADDLSATEGVRLSTLLPPWLFPFLGLLAVALVAVVLWRARRLGPLVTEPLPVVVRAAESTESRGRLYRRTGDRNHAAAILVGATRRRLGETLGLPPHSPPDAIALVAAQRTGLDPHELTALLTTTSVPSTPSLADLGRRLADLENEVRRR